MPAKRKRAGGGGGGKRRRDELELETFDPSRFEMSDDEDKEIMFNRPGGMVDEEGDEIDPRFAHRVEGLDVDGGLGDVDKEEEQLAADEQKRRAALLEEDDFGLSELVGGEQKRRVVKPKKRDHRADMEALDKFLSAQVGAATTEVEKDHSGLSAEQKRKMLERDSPELIPLLKEFKDKLAHARTVLAPIIERARAGDIPTSEGVSFLDLKLQLFLSYLMHVSFYLVLKAEGKPVRNNPVVDKLVELRAYMDRLKPIEKRLQHQIQGLLARAAVGTAAPDAEETGVGRANLTELARAAPEADGDGIYRAGKRSGGAPDPAERKRREARMLELHKQQMQKSEEDAMLRAPSSKKMEKQLKRAKLGGVGAVDESVGDGALDPGLRGSLLDPRSGVMAQVRRMQASDPHHMLDKEDDEEEEESEGEDEALGGDDLDEFYKKEVEERQEERKKKRKASRAAAAAQPKAPKRGELKQGEAAEIVEGHRKVSKAITVNRGLTPKRNKKMKNPRVRSKYRAGKLDVKRRSQVKDVRKPASVYQGERSIRSDVVRSHKMVS